MTGSKYTSGIEAVTTGTDLETATINLALLDETASFDSTDETFSDINGAEISGDTADDYPAGGKEVKNTNIDTDLAAEDVRLRGDDVVFETNGTIEADAAVLYLDSDGTLLGLTEFAETETAEGTEQDAVPFRVEEPADGYLVFEADN